jgi:Spy/CpxP family protein refolding chaperone
MADDTDPNAGDQLAKRLKDLEAKLTELETDRDKWKDLSRKHEERSKANSDAADELKKLRESKQTDEEKLADQLAELKKRADDADLRAVRAEVAQAKGLTPAQAKRLQGVSRDELESDAEDLLQSFPAPKGEGDEGKPKGAAGAARKPTEKLSAGNDPTEEPEETDPRKLAAQVPRF